MAFELFELILKGNSGEIEQVFAKDPGLANVGMPCDDKLFSKKGHPLHRLCDAVFFHKITDEQAIDVAKVFLKFGANVDGYKLQGDNNTPLIAAASLHAEKLGIFYVEHGADIFYADKDGATALHWAAFCGLDLLMRTLIDKGANINQTDKKFNSTPTGWAIHALTSNNEGNMYHQLACVKLLLKAGADQTLLDENSIRYLQEAAKEDLEIKTLIR